MKQFQMNIKDSSSGEFFDEDEFIVSVDIHHFKARIGRVYLDDSAFGWKIKGECIEDVATDCSAITHSSCDYRSAHYQP